MASPVDELTRPRAGLREGPQQAITPITIKLLALVQLTCTVGNLLIARGGARHAAAPGPGRLLVLIEE
jgi:hypothetical protein